MTKRLHEKPLEEVVDLSEFESYDAELVDKWRGKTVGDLTTHIASITTHLCGFRHERDVFDFRKCIQRPTNMLCGHSEDVALQLLLGSACLRNTHRIPAERYEAIKHQLQGEYFDTRDREAYDYGRSSSSVQRNVSGGAQANIEWNPVEYFQHRQREVIPTIKPIIEEVLDGLLQKN